MGWGGCCENVLLIRAQCGEGVARHRALWGEEGLLGQSSVSPSEKCEASPEYMSTGAIFGPTDIFPSDPWCLGELDVKMDPGRWEKVDPNLHT